MREFSDCRVVVLVPYPTLSSFRFKNASKSGKKWPYSWTKIMQKVRLWFINCASVYYVHLYIVIMWSNSMDGDGIFCMWYPLKYHAVSLWSSSNFLGPWYEVYFKNSHFVKFLKLSCCEVLGLFMIWGSLDLPFCEIHMNSHA